MYVFVGINISYDFFILSRSGNPAALPPLLEVERFENECIFVSFTFLDFVASDFWSTWSAVGNLTSRAGELRSAPSGPDDRHRVAGKRALALGGARPFAGERAVK